MDTTIMNHNAKDCQCHGVIRRLQNQEISWKNHAHYFCDAQGLIILYFLPRGETVNSEVNMETFQ